MPSPVTGAEAAEVLKSASYYDISAPANKSKFTKGEAHMPAWMSRIKAHEVISHNSAS